MGNGVYNAPEEEIKELASKLEVLGHFVNDNAQAETRMGTVYLRASKWLRTMQHEVCAQGFICRGGAKCTSDHK